MNSLFSILVSISRLLSLRVGGPFHQPRTAIPILIISFIAVIVGLAILYARYYGPLMSALNNTL